MRPILCLLIVTGAIAVETTAVPVLRVIDGDTIEVAADLGGQVVPVRVRLLYVDTPEAKDNDHGKAMDEGREATAFIRGNVPSGGVILHGPAETFAHDAHGRVLAIVECNDGAHEDLSGLLIANGLSAYWRKYGEAPEPWHSMYVAAETHAREAKLGTWATAPQWMQDKANERTAPKKDKP